MHVLVISFILLGVVLPVFAEQPIVGIQKQQGTVQVGHIGTGKVVAVDKTNLNIKLAHEAIKSLGWPSMTMDFKVTKAAVLDGIKAGDMVTFELDKNDKTGKWQVTQIKLQ